MYSCAGCGVSDDPGQHRGYWWTLRNYYGLTGSFCPSCYDLVSHDGFGQPKHPEEYVLMILKVKT